MKYLMVVLCILTIGCGPEEEGAWQTIELGTDAEFRDIFFLDALNGWMVGGVGVSVPGGIVARTRDGGLTWQYATRVIPERPRTMSIDMNAVHFVDPMSGIIAAESGTIMRTVDGGESWQKVPPTGPIYAPHQDVDFVDDKNGWIVGRQGVLRTKDGGASWKKIDENLKIEGEALDMLDIRRGWMVGKFGSISRTNDGGINWEIVPALGDLEGLSGDEKPHLRSVHFVDEDHGWAAGYWREMPELEQFDWAVIIHTSDGGQTWQHQIDGVESHLMSIRFVDRNRGWTVGYNRNNGTSLILHTENGGATWEPAKMIEGEELRAVEVRDGYVWTAGDRVWEGKQRLFRLTLPVTGGGHHEGIDENE